MVRPFLTSSVLEPAFLLDGPAVETQLAALRRIFQSLKSSLFNLSREFTRLFRTLGVWFRHGASPPALAQLAACRSLQLLMFLPSSGQVVLSNWKLKHKIVKTPFSNSLFGFSSLVHFGQPISQLKKAATKQHTVPINRDSRAPVCNRTVRQG